MDFANETLWKELVQLHESGKLQVRMERLYFAARRPMVEVYDLVNDPGDHCSVAGDLKAAVHAREPKATQQERMNLARDFLPLAVAPTECPGARPTNPNRNFSNP